MELPFFAQRERVQFIVAARYAPGVADARRCRCRPHVYFFMPTLKIVALGFRLPRRAVFSVLRASRCASCRA